MVALLALMVISYAFAQEEPVPGGGEPGGAPAGDRRDGPGGGDHRDGPPMRRGNGPGMGMGMGRGPGGPGMGPGGPGGPPPPPPPPVSDRIRHVEMLRGYLDLVEQYAQMANNPTNSGVAAVITAGDILKAKGPDSAIEYFTKLLPDVKDASVQRAIRIQLADLYKASGQSDKALEQLRTLMTGAAPTTAPSSPGNSQ
jgi:hypothetical protein